MSVVSSEPGLQARHTAQAASSSPAAGSALPAWLKEPLLHFVALGALLFALDHALISRAEDPRVIVVGAEVDREARLVFKSSRGREPTAQELKALRQVWLDNEVLYREGLALQVDRGDSAIRERVIFKALSVVDANVKPPAADEAALRRWFESQRARYDEPARIDFQEAVLSGERTEAAVRGFVDLLSRGGGGELNAGLRLFKGRPQSTLVQSYGVEFANALPTQTVGEWRALRALDGWHAIRLDTVIAPKPADFAVMRGMVQQDWTDAQMAEQRTAAVRALTRKYRVKQDSVEKDSAAP